MTDEIIAIDNAKNKRTATKFAAKGCQCRSKSPVFEEFTLPDSKGKGSLVGHYCPECYIVHQWSFVPNDPSVKKADPTPEQPKAETPKAEKPKKEAPKAPETTAQVTEQLKESIKVEQAKKEEKEPVTLELRPEDEKPQRFFPVTSVNPVAGVDTEVAFMLTQNGLPFIIKVKNSVEKVKMAINNPRNYVGKFAELEYSETDENGFPKNIKMKSLKTRDEVNQILNPVTA